MKKAIKTLEAKIERLNSELEKAQQRMDEPEMVSDYEFALNDCANIELEIIEHQDAIKLLNDSVK